MPLDESFWTTGYEDILADLSAPSAETSVIVGGQRQVGGIYYQFRDFTNCDFAWIMPENTSSGDLASHDPEYGYIYALDSGGDEHAVGLTFAWYKAANYQNWDPESTRLVFPFIRSSDDIPGGPWWTGRIIAGWPTSGGSDISLDLYLYQPHTWHGTVAEVIAAILLHVGVGATYIDTQSFDDAYDGHVAWGDTDFDRPVIVYKREIGKTVGDSLKGIARHTRDLLAFDMSGRIGLYSRNAPSADYTLSGLSTDDGVVDLSWRVAYEHFANSVSFTTGQWLEVTPFDGYTYWILSYGDAGAYVRMIEGATFYATPPPSTENSEYPTKKYEDAESIAANGNVSLKNSSINIIDDGRRYESDSFHLPYLMHFVDDQYSPDRFSYTNDFDDVRDSAKDNYMSYLSVTESVPRREVKVKQDMRGADYDVGWYIEDVDLTGDGETFNAFCIEKTIDFRSMTVTSVLLEEPS